MICTSSSKPSTSFASGTPNPLLRVGISHEAIMTALQHPEVFGNVASQGGGAGGEKFYASIPARHFLDATNANNDRTSRSIETEGSPHSIFATLDWLDLIPACEFSLVSHLALR